MGKNDTNNITIDAPEGNEEKTKKDFLPIPLKHVAAKHLSTVPIYINTDDDFCLYSNDGLGFSAADRERLLESKVRYVFVAKKDHDKYFDAVAGSIGPIVNDDTITPEEKKGVIHGTTLDLACQLNTVLPDKKKVDQTINNSNCNAQMIMNGMTVKEMYEMCINDPDEAKHLVKMSTIMQGFAHTVGLNDKYSLSMMGTGAMLHDIGKIFIPKENRTVEMLRSHVEKGVNHLDSLPGTPLEIRSIVAEHHERIDGSGYPYGLRGDDISLMGQIAGLAYTFETLVSEKCEYQSEKKSIEDSLQVLSDDLSSQFESNLLKSFTSFAATTLLDEAEDKARLRLFDISSLDSEHRKNNPSGRRHERLFFRSKGIAEILFLKNERWTVRASHDIIMHNVSQSGMGFMIYQQLDKGQIVLTKLFIDQQSEPVCLLGKVVRVQEVTKDLYIIGCIFFESNSFEATKKLYEKFTSRKYL